MESLTPKKLTIQVPHVGVAYTFALLSGVSNKALRIAIASRVRMPLAHDDGSETFYLTDGPPNGTVFPVCAEGLPDGASLTMHVHPPPADPREANPSTPRPLDESAWVGIKHELAQPPQPFLMLGTWLN